MFGRLKFWKWLDFIYLCVRIGLNQPNKPINNDLIWLSFNGDIWSKPNSTKPLIKCHLVRLYFWCQTEPYPTLLVGHNSRVKKLIYAKNLWQSTLRWKMERKIHYLSLKPIEQMCQLQRKFCMAGLDIGRRFNTIPSSRIILVSSLALSHSSCVYGRELSP